MYSHALNIIIIIGYRLGTSSFVNNSSWFSQLMAPLLISQMGSFANVVIHIVTLHACTRGKMISSVVVIVVMVTKITKSGDLGEL